ncbi:MAG: hemerythrin family protein [Candidatus Heimdallarchaeota archaeon]|nr:hemerythrin family protein [Candidatus Heimdallarchaeota archaeon]
MSIEWSPKLTSGNKTIDDQHLKLINKINELFVCIKQNKAKDKIEDSLSFLMNYIDFHFNEEEEFMDQHKYGNIEEHHALHQFFVNKLDELRSKYVQTGGDLKQALEIHRFMSDWWQKHIMNTDVIMIRAIEQSKK